MKSKISIILPIYNAEKYLKRCIESIINQTLKEIEIICINDGSTDTSKEILMNYIIKDKRIVYLEQKNLGVSAARNRGIDVATAKYIMFVDADDWIDLNTCEIAYKELQENKADVVMWNYIREYQGNSLPKVIFPEEKIIFKDYEVKEKLEYRYIGMTDEEIVKLEDLDILNPLVTKLYKKEIIKTNKINFSENQSVGEDLIFNLFVFKNLTKVVYLNRNMYHYQRDNMNSKTRKYKSDLVDEFDRIYRIIFQYIDDNKLIEKKKLLYNRVAVNIVGLGLNIVSSKLTVFERLKEINKILKKDIYVKAIKQLKLKYLPIHWKIFFICAKLKFIIALYIMLYIMERIRNGRAKKQNKCYNGNF